MSKQLLLAAICPCCILPLLLLPSTAQAKDKSNSIAHQSLTPWATQQSDPHSSPTSRAPSHIAQNPIPVSPGDQLLEKGNQHYQAGALEAAISAWQQARTAYQQQQNLLGEQTVLSNLGTAYISLDRYQEAVDSLLTVIPIAQSRNDDLAEAQSLSNLGIAYKALGNYTQAIQAHQDAGKRMRVLGDRPGLGQVLANLGNVFEAIGDYSNAAIAYQQSLKIAQQVKDRLGENIALGNLGTVYANIGRNQEAITHFQQSLAIGKATQDSLSQATALLNLGSVYHSQGDRAKALQYYQDSLAIAQTLTHRSLEWQVLSSLGLIYEDSKDNATALKYHQKSLQIAQSLKDPVAQGKVLNNLAHSLFGAGKLAEAEANLRRAIEILDALRPGLSDTYQVSIFDTQIHTYSLLQQVLIAANQPETALEAAEQGRARAFVELLAKRDQRQETGDKNQKQSKIQNPKSKIQNQAFDLVRPITISEIKELARSQRTTLVEYAIVPDDDFKFRGKQRARESELFIWVVSPNGRVNFRRVDLKPLWSQELTLAKLVSITRNCLFPGNTCRPVSPSYSPTSPTSPTHPHSPTSSHRRPNPALARLHQLLIAPIADLLPSQPEDRIMVIPQESLFLVPFPALQSPNGTYLIENHTLLTAPSIQVLALNQLGKTRSTPSPKLLQNPKSKIQNPNPLIVGNPIMPKLGEYPLSPLPQAEEEAKQIATLLNTQALTGNRATETQVLQRLRQAKLVHLATHGLLHYGQELGETGIPGAIALTPDKNHNGLLTASEIFDLQLTADLVVLSACDTGRGRITGDGVIGLSRAFMAAGVPSLVVSLWAVPDAATAELMVAFYRELLKHPDKAKALRQAMLLTLKTNPRPIDWAAFTLIGSAD